MGNSAALMPLAGGAESADTENVFLTKKLAHGCNLFIADEKAREAFVNFLKDGDWLNEYLRQTTEAVPGLEADLVSEVPPEASADAASTEPETFHDYILPDGMKVENIEVLLKAKNAHADKAADVESIIESCFMQTGTRALLLASVFPLFLESPQYERWVTEQTALAAGTGADETPVTAQEAEADANEGREERLDELFVPSNRRIKDIVGQALASIDPVEIELMLVGGDWLRSLTSAVEDLPLCVTLASAREERRGFPLVYVNRAFEQATGYDRADIVGKNCNFLQTDTSETQQIQKMSEALRNAKPVKVAITNYRKDGEPFINLLAMKPIFDAEGTYAFVVGVQFDITDKEASLVQMKMVDDLLSILPNVLK
jgi:PAS domain S-box-containing protein